MTHTPIGLRPDVRSDFPALDSGSAFFDSPGGTQTPTPVIEAIAAALSAPLANRSRLYPAARNADDITLGARAAMADLRAPSRAGSSSAAVRPSSP